MQNNKNNPSNISEIIRNNAIITYVFFLINLSFFKTKNSNINNEFVLNHTKTAILIHLGFLFTIIIFKVYGLGLGYRYFGYTISDIIAIILFLIFFIFLLIGAYKAYNYQNFNIIETINFKYDKKILDVSESGNFNERDKLTIIFSLIPFFGYIIFPKYYKNKLIVNNIKLNSIITLLITFLYIFANNNLATLVLLVYLIFIAFAGIYLFFQEELISFNLNFVPTYIDLKIRIKSFGEYLKNYFKSSKDFVEYNNIYKKNKLNYIKYHQNKTEELLKKSGFKLSNKIIYIPILNFITIFNLNTKQKKHIINGILISLGLVITIILDGLNYINSNYILLFLFPLTLGIGYLNAGIMNYEIPILYTIFNIFVSIKNKIKSIFIKTKKIQNTTKEIHLKTK